MAHPFDTLSRLKKALEFRNLDPANLDVSSLCHELMRRGNADRRVDSSLSGIVNLLEPPSCYMTHCKHYGGVSSFCNCAKPQKEGEPTLIPGKCSIYRQYNQRKKAKNEKLFDGLIEAEQEVLRFAFGKSEIRSAKGMLPRHRKAIKTLTDKDFLFTFKRGIYEITGKGQECVKLGAPPEEKKTGAS